MVEDVALEPAQPSRRLETELVIEPLAESADEREGLDVVSAAIVGHGGGRGQVFRVGQGLRPGEQLGAHLPMATTEQLDIGQQRHEVDPRGLVGASRGVDGLDVVDAPEGLAAPEPQRGTEPARGEGRVGERRAARPPNRPGHLVGVELTGLDDEPVGVVDGDEAREVVVAHRRPDAVDVDPERRASAGRRLPSPELVHEQVGRHRAVGVAHEQGKKGALLRAESKGVAVHLDADLAQRPEDHRHCASPPELQHDPCASMVGRGRGAWTVNRHGVVHEVQANWASVAVRR